MAKICAECKKELNASNTADGVNGFEKRVAIKEYPEKTQVFELCKSCYVDFRKESDPSFKI